MSDPGIICFQHCERKIFCKQLPDICPICSSNLQLINSTLLPFRLPYPFVKPHQHPCSIILRPTVGDFMNDYLNATDLHIGVTTSSGVIVEFDQNGLKYTEKNDRSCIWSQSLLVECIPDAWWDHWDQILSETCSTDKWNATVYQENTNNCYTFVLTFLSNLNYGSLSSTARNRTLFCEKYIVPRTVAAGKYISLYRKIRDNGHYIHPVDSTNINTNVCMNTTSTNSIATTSSSSSSSSSISSTNNGNSNDNTIAVKSTEKFRTSSKSKLISN